MARICLAPVSFERPWQAAGDALEMAKRKADVAFEFFYKLNVPYYCFHDVDVSPRRRRR
ncbi:Xylose isomerase [Klebsiella pneumoniae]|uniref:xylose isomerase n=1 Tax=Klebsiella pneumoniae TaxID=573 RepID=A0A2X3FF60_KLEPN|nr:Xylose isomerase [Klebsiella pneumoniae]